MGHVDYSLQGSVAVLAFQNPPVNSLSRSLRIDLVAAVERALADPAAEAMVFIGANGTFCAGADIKEFTGADMTRGPNIWSLYAMLDDSPKPVVAAIEGVALGGGLEFALACHYRVVLSSAKVGLPEVKLGILPGAGGTQRLPRIIGVEGALNVMLSGEPLPVAMFAKSPLFDKVVDKDLLPAAIEVAQAAVAARKADPSKPLPRIRDRRVKEPNLEGLLQFARNTARAAFKEYPAPIAIIDAVAAAAKLPFDAGLAEEARLFQPLMGSSVSRSLRHIFFAERAAQRVDGLPPKTPTRDIKAVAIIGAGTMGTGIAINFLNAGHPARTCSKSARRRSIAASRGSARTTRARSRRAGWTRRSATRTLALLAPTLQYADIAGDDLVIEAVFEDMGVKEKVFRQLDSTMKPGAILASNTSTLDVDQIAALHEAPAGRDRPALLQPRERDEAARGGARREDRARRAGDGDGAGKEDPQDRGGLGRLRRLHRQPHDQPVLRAGDADGRRGREPAAGRRGDREVRLRDGPVPDERPRRQRHRLRTSASASTPRSQAAEARSDRRPAVRARPLRAEERVRLVRLQGRAIAPRIRRPSSTS